PPLRRAPRPQARRSCDRYHQVDRGSDRQVGQPGPPFTWTVLSASYHGVYHRLVSFAARRRWVVASAPQAVPCGTGATTLVVGYVDPTYRQESNAVGQRCALQEQSGKYRTDSESCERPCRPLSASLGSPAPWCEPSVWAHRGDQA